MIDYKQYLVISDSNWRQYAALAPGEKKEQTAELVEALQGSTGYKGWQNPAEQHIFRGPKPPGTPIPRSQWADMIRAGSGLAAFNALATNNIQAKDQNGLGYCWVYGSTRAVELRRVLEGLPQLDLSPESVGGPCTNWRNQGGYAGEAFTQIQNAGICESSYMDAPCSLHPSRWKTGWQDNAKLHEAVDWYNIDGSDSGPIFDEVISCLLNNSPVAAGLGWWGHLICFIAPVLLADGSVGVLFQNSWGVDWPTTGANGLAILTESRATPDGAASPIVTTDAPVNPPDPVPINPNL
jgi:hypothetical protein